MTEDIEAQFGNDRSEVQDLKKRVQFLENFILRQHPYYWDDLESRHENIISRLESLDSKISEISSCCSENSDAMQFMVSAGGRSSAIADLRGFTAYAGELIIIDPYFLSGDRSNARHDAEELLKVLNAKRKKLTKVHIIYDPAGGETRGRVKQIITQFDAENVKVTKKGTSKIHDRIWIADKQRAKLVGNSIGGLGEKKLSFILDLPQSDLEKLLNFLDTEQSLLGEDLRKYL